jgi:hypothetical protein
MYMNASVKKLLAAGIVLGIVGAGIGFYLGNKKVEGLESAKPDFTLTATELFTEFSANEAEAVKKFNGKTVQVEGNIQDIQPVNDTTASVLLMADENGLGTVKCGLDKNYAKAAQELKIEQPIKLKCVCSGVTKVEDFGITMMDIELSRCVIVK